ncbi:hypothetical protein DDE18_09995 [Nocardioides gansuensis]|uniref:YlxR domain-containing protein n=1 Tax=Nocardioides gansuensis TaxID=2138300 RepID=A0A2T8FBD7_9ACTN|nr:YlxR family protein [Nocardioides gansuensis]PVG83031.1 hypothetical protein DDE18_09995 [Nocardioides gansuensis]
MRGLVLGLAVACQQQGGRALQVAHGPQARRASNPVRDSGSDAIQSSSVVPSRQSSTSGPVRTCVGCRTRAARSELLRVVAGSGPDGLPAVVPDPGHTAPGRGAHLHPTSECYEQAVRRRAFTRALRLSEGLPSTPVADYIASLPTMTPHDRPETGARSS